MQSTYALDERLVGRGSLGNLVEQDQQLRALLRSIDCVVFVDVSHHGGCCEKVR